MIAALWLCVAGLSGDFEDGIEAFEAERYEEARECFEAALADPTSSRGPLYYNLGHCAFRLGEPARAVVYYTAALQHMPLEPAVSRDRNLARRELGLPTLEPESPGPFARFDSLPAGTRLAIVGGLQAVALFGLFLSRDRRARPLLLAILVIAWVGAVHLLRTETERPSFTAVVVAEDLGVRGEPHTNLANRFELSPGELVRVHEHSPRWVRISHERGEGWVERAGLGWVE